MNVSIPDGAAALGVSETKLRRTLLETAVPTLTEFRQTRTGVRKTTVLSVETLAQLRSHFENALQNNVQSDRSGRDEADIAAQPLNDFFAEPAESSFEPGPKDDRSASQLHSLDQDSEPADTYAIAFEPVSVNPAIYNQSVPLTQFNALLYQHNVLREELSRVSEYVEGCDRLLGEMVRTIATLEERTRAIEPPRSQKRSQWNPLAGAFSRVTASVQNAISIRRPASAMVPSTEVYYGSVLAGR